MGLAILWIFLYHSKIFFPESTLFHPLRFVTSSGYGGVDIFFFLSGFGLMRHMLTQKSSSLTFYKKRLLALFPSYIPTTMLVLYITHILSNNVSLKMIILCLTTIGFWTDGYTFYWFIPSILSLYLIYPIFYKFYLKYQIKLIYFISLLSLATCIVLAITKHFHFINFISRIPIFFIGSHVQYISTSRNALSKKEIHFQFSLFLIFFISLIGVMLLPNKNFIKNYGLGYYPFTIGTLPLCLVISIVLNKLSQVYQTKNRSRFFVLLSICGSTSLEIYLIHKQIVFNLGELIIAKAANIPQELSFINYGHYLEYIIYFIITLPLSLQLKRLSSYIRTRINRSIVTVAPPDNIPK